MNTHLPTHLNAGSTVLAGLSVEELRAELAATLTVTARHLEHLASVWKELERRGEDLSNLRSGLWSYMPMIARGDLRAELVVRYAGYTTLLRRVAQLPAYVQDQLIADDIVTIVEIGESGLTERAVPLIRVRGPDLPRVIGDRIITVEEQKRALQGKARTVIAPPARGGSAVDRAVAASRGRGRGSGMRTRPLSIRVRDEEWAALQTQAERAGLPLAKLVLGALLSAGLLAAPD